MSETKRSSSTNSGNSSADDRAQQLYALSRRFLRFEDDRLGDLAVEHGWITAAQLDACRKEAERRGTRLDDELKRSGILSAEQLNALNPPKPGAPVVPSDVIEARRNSANLFGKYVLVREIGRGGMGIVFRAWQTDLGRWVALKRLKPEAEGVVSRFLREGRLAAQVVHPHLVPIHEVGDVGGVHFLAMAFIDGGSLEHKRLPIRRALEIVLHTAQAAQTLHEAGILHRDIKPGNIFADASGHVYLGDFSLARTEDAAPGLSKSGFMLGTPAFAPPEQVRGDTARIGPGSDVYALGATLYALLTGLPPFSGTDAVEVIQRSLDTDAPDLRRTVKGADAGVQTLCWKAMRKNVEDRYPSAAEFAADIRRYLDGEPLKARPPGAAERVRRMMHRHGVKIAAVATLLVLVGGVVWVQAAREAGDRAVRSGRIRDLLVEAKSQEREGHMEKSRDAWKLVTELDPENGESREELKRTSYKIRESARLVEEGRPAIERAAGYEYRADVPIEQWLAEAERGRTLIKEAVALTPDKAVARLLLGRAEMALGNWEAAEAELRSAVKLAPDLEAAADGLGRFLVLRAGLLMLGVEWRAQLPQARALAMEAGRVIGTRNRLRETLVEGILAMIDGDIPKASQILDSGLREFENADGVEELMWARTFCIQTDRAEVVQVLDRVLTIRPRFLPALFVRGTEHLQSTAADLAVRDLSDVLKINPAFAAARIARGNALLLLGRNEEAVGDLTEYLIGKPDDTKALLYRGQARIPLQNWTGAKEDLNGALRGKDLTMEERISALCLRAGILQELKDYDGVMEDADRALQINDRVFFAHMLRGRVFEVRGQPDQAVAAYEKALEVGPPEWPNRAQIVERVRALKSR